MDNFPIINIYKGDNLSLWFVINQIKFFNPKSEIYLIGDEKNKKYGKLIKHFDVSDYMEEANEFAKYYKHFSPNPYGFELFCIQRWFVLKNFMQKNNMSNCFYMDSDVMVYSNISNERQKFKDYDLTINNKKMGHCMFINNIKALENFCEYILRTYKEKQLPEIKDEFKNYLADKKEGISDMTFLNAFFINNPKKIIDTYKIIEDSIYDNCFIDSGDFKMNSRFSLFSKYKKIIFKGKKPYLIKKENGDFVRLNCIHFQGPTKKFIPFFCSNKNLRFFLQLAKVVCHYVIKGY